MKRILAMILALPLTVCLADAAFAQGNGPYGRAVGNGNNGSCVRTMAGALNCPSTGTTMGTSSGVVSGNVGTSTGVSGTMMTGRSTVYSAVNRAPVVPAGALETARTSSSAGTIVTYRSGNTYYQVTYAPNGIYTYVMSRTPSAVAGSMSSTGTTASTSMAGTASSTTTGTVAGTSGTTSTAGGTSMLPRTGGGAPPGVPLLPLLAGLMLIATGVLTRQVAFGTR